MYRNVFIHETANIEEGVTIGEHSKIWDHVHIRKDAHIGHDTTIGEKSYIAYGVTIGNFVKINAMVYIPAYVTVEDFCMISAGTVFTNDLYPRAMNPDLTALMTSEPTEDTLATIVKKGVTIGANATIGPGITLGEFSMIGMGSVVTKSVPDFGLVLGNPAHLVGFVCICGPSLLSLKNPPQQGAILTCEKCHRKYQWNGDRVTLHGVKDHAST
jgi:acetyltransferase-like isoleucine patch superfamily enzyme